MASGCGAKQPSPQGEWTTEPIEWFVLSIEEPRTVNIRGTVDYCVGAPKPRISKVDVVYDGREVLMTAFMTSFVRGYRENEVRTEICSGVGLFMDKAVRLDRPVRDSVLFDASMDPPIERWPDDG